MLVVFAMLGWMGGKGREKGKGGRNGDSEELLVGPSLKGGYIPNSQVGIC
jgi:hypothetical protein